MTSRLHDIALSETGFVFDPWTGASFTVNATGLCVLEGLRDGLGRAAIAERLAERFDVRDGAAAGTQDLARDVDEFVTVLRHHDLVPREWEVPS